MPGKHEDSGYQPKHASGKAKGKVSDKGYQGRHKADKVTTDTEADGITKRIRSKKHWPPK